MSKRIFENILTSKRQLRLSSSTRSPAASRWRHVPPTQQPYDVPANEPVPCPTRRVGSVEKHPPRDGCARSPGWRRIVPKKPLRLPISAWPPADSRSRHGRPTQQPYEVKEQAPMTNSASGGRGEALPGTPLLSSRGGGESFKNGNPSVTQNP